MTIGVCGYRWHMVIEHEEGQIQTFQLGGGVNKAHFIFI